MTINPSYLLSSPFQALDVEYCLTSGEQLRKMFLDLLAMCEEFEVRVTKLEAGAKEFQKSANIVDKWHSNTWECITKNLGTKQKEDCDDLVNTAVNKLDKADCATDDNDRLKKVMESKAAGDDARMKQLEEELHKMQKRCEDADSKYEEIQKKVNLTETELEKAEVRAEIGEMKLGERAGKLEKCQMWLESRLRSLETKNTSNPGELVEPLNEINLKDLNKNTNIANVPNKKIVNQPKTEAGPMGPAPPWFFLQGGQRYSYMPIG